MTTRSLPVRSAIAALKAYDLLPEAGPPVLAKLDFNESPFDVPEKVKAVVLSRLKARRWGLYPEFGAARLREAIARFAGRSPSEIVVGNGSGEVILAAVSVFAGGGELILAPPTFSLYRQVAAIAAARLVEVPRLGESFLPDEEGLLKATRRGKGRAVPLICSPNNPTGGTARPDLIRALSRAAPVVLLDQAYVDFAGEEDDALGLLPECGNLVLFRTLSKAFSAAGFRIGYAVAPPELAREIGKALLPFNVGVAAEELALALLEDPAPARRRVESVVAERARVEAALRGAGCAVAPSRANFLFFSPPGGDGSRVRAALRSRGVLVRDMSSAAPGRLRVTIGSADLNDLFLAALKESL